MDKKTCTKCKETKEISEFYKSKYYRDGIKSTCKRCQNAHNTRYQKDRYKAGQQVALAALKCKVCGEPITGATTVLRKYCDDCRYFANKLAGNAWALANADKRRAYRQKWYQLHKEHVKLKRAMCFNKPYRLYDIPEKSKIYTECSDGSAYITFDHLDGMYSYCVTEKGAVVHLGASAPLIRHKDGYKLNE